MKTVGECKRCGACCTTNIQWITCRVEDSPMHIEWATMHGMKIIQAATSKNQQWMIIQAQFKLPCPELDENKLCKLQGDSKPELCRRYPQTVLEEVWDLDMSLVLAPTCGYRFVKEEPRSMSTKSSSIPKAT